MDSSLCCYFRLLLVPILVMTPELRFVLHGYDALCRHEFVSGGGILPGSLTWYAVVELTQGAL